MSDRKLYGELALTYKGNQIGRAFITGYDEAGVFAYMLVDDLDALVDITTLIEGGELPSMSFNVGPDDG